MLPDGSCRNAWRLVATARMSLTATAQLRHGCLDVVHQQRQVLTVLVGHGGLDEVHLLRTRVEPRAGEPEVGAIGALGEAQYVDVERHRGRNIGDVDGHVVDSGGAHPLSLAVARRAVLSRP
jgi:hypothetical protein